MLNEIESQINNLQNNDFNCNILIVLNLNGSEPLELNRLSNVEEYISEDPKFVLSQSVYYDEYKSGRFEIFIYRTWGDEKDNDTINYVIGKFKAKSKLILSVVQHGEGYSRLVFTIPKDESVRIELPVDLSWIEYEEKKT